MFTEKEKWGKYYKVVLEEEEEEEREEKEARFQRTSSKRVVKHTPSRS